MIERFAGFDHYQLSKHGKKTKKEKIPLENLHLNQEEVDVWADDKDELATRRFSVKRLIRLLHIKEPTFSVMAILGKK